MICYGNLMFLTVKYCDERFKKGRAGFSEYTDIWIDWNKNPTEWRYETIIIPYPFEKVEKVG